MILENIQDIVILIGVNPDAGFTVLYVNQAFPESLGHDDVAGKKVVDVVGEKVYKKLRQHYIQVINTRKLHSYRTETDTPTGHKVFDVKLLPVLNALGECKQIIAISHEVK
jgi:hypothetical protein